MVLLVLTRSLMRPVSRTVRLSTGDSAGAPGLFRVDADTSPSGSEDATPGSACVCVCGCVLARPGVAAGPPTGEFAKPPSVDGSLEVGGLSLRMWM